ncbi:MAG: glycerol-3-phosphate dehydrogenase/oxidase [Flavobacteriia bacterium]|nr:glycerol-3-phosphate dehydrogenase/oxidase [Flavobacteriia bacterium]OIP47659.1 MAG: glycerol-3-phosphate dehydrogenase [Flavobacteriaceae bacterium CG2_30_31_66]PIV97350.1 MAG: glycerol-3-phosphate dehydrogenase [Flavobacteriaceae bacterium CG17_big_fil_post_rev_8_21_14_2_50_31_13]PIX13324.1 MAG: glycerol-3-phosphate dehydrogenase [Flavobacteriaceae bacterium CG_4_8_14_3_um_filter_31_8]PIY14707.1 MAG: glycerol-3-phosphate dehydrogenase [Flavobacteriaceae bacterium CG_4_10_14_3_um_filter_31_
MINFSYFNRKNIQIALQTVEFDILIIGGGITGAGIALDAASRGMKVALIEKNDFASGTSSKSTKLIHGGLRYLKQFDFWLVKEVGTERAIVHKLAPHLVVPEKMILPLIEGGSYGSWLTSFGLKVYDILASVEGDDKRKMLTKEEALEKEPLLPKSILNGAGFYAEYRTDDARLTIEILKTSLNYHAKALNYLEATDFLYKEKRVVGAKVIDTISNETFEISAKYVVNAAGPWVDELRQINHSKIGKRLHLTKGVHLVVAHEKLPVKQAVYFDIPDGRMMFAIPRGKVTYFGTTDTNYQENKNTVNTDLVDATYLISAVNNMFPEINITLDDIQSSWAGLRPLIHEEGKSASELSRKDEIFVSETELISIAGGKLTGYRKMAERIVDLVAKKYERRFDKKFDVIKTEKIVLSGGTFKNSNEVKSYTDAIYNRINEVDFTQKDAEYLVHNYGKQTDIILKKFDEFIDENQTEKLLKAEVWFTIHYEMACTPTDFFMRRTGRLFFDKPNVNLYKNLVLQLFKEHFNWDEKTKNLHQNDLEHQLKMATSFS